MIAQPVFFARGDCVADHADWRPRIQGITRSRWRADAVASI